MGFDVIGLDISIDMVTKARELDHHGDYRMVSDGDYQYLGIGQYDLAQAIFTFDNIAGKEICGSCLSSKRKR